MHVTPYEIGRYFVSSESGNEPYMVDILAGGGCDCDDYRIRVSGLKEKATCKHCEAARAVWNRDFSEDERAQIVKQQTKPKSEFDWPEREESEEWKEYERLKQIERAKPGNLQCCVPGCANPAAKSPHHSRGRRHLLNVVEYWRWPCVDCHEKAHRDPEWGRAVGLFGPVGSWLHADSTGGSSGTIPLLSRA